jgi:hypothetical protein
MTTTLTSPVFERLQSEARLLKPALQGATHTPGRFGFRGEIALTSEPPVTLKEAFATADNNEAKLSFLAGSLDSFKQLPALITALGDTLQAGGKYFVYTHDLDRASRYQIEFNDVLVYVLPIDDTSVYNELIDFLYLDKTKMKKMDTGEKVDTIVAGALSYNQAYERISFEEGLKRL